MTIAVLDSFRSIWKPRIDQELRQILEEVELAGGCPARLVAAMRDAVLGGGKRLRPLLVLAAARAVGADETSALRPACAMELIHAYSLVHDDLPALDDDDFRRGRPTCHRAHGEALAILAGDGLLTLAFSVLTGSVPAKLLPAVLERVARAAGPNGMVGGQADDIEELAERPTVAEVEGIHARKTGALFSASVAVGGLLGGSAGQRAALEVFAADLGLAFQIADDLLAHRGDAEALGRPTGSDVEKRRRTHPLAASPEVSRARALELIASARAALDPLGEPADVLHGLIDLVAARAG